MELGNSVGAHQPDEAVAWVPADQLAKRVDGEARPEPRLEIADPDWGSPRHLPGGRKPRLERCHAFVGLERIAGRDQPPHLVEAERVERSEADPAMPAVRRIERAAEKSDALHRREQLAWPPCCA